MKKNIRLDRNAYRIEGTALSALAAMIALLFIPLLILPSAFAQADAISQDGLLIEVNPIKSRFEFNYSGETDRKAAFDYLLRAEIDREDMLRYDLSVNYMQDIMLKADRAFIGRNTTLVRADLDSEKDRDKIAYLNHLLEVINSTPAYEIENLNYTKVIMLSELVRFRKEQAYRILDAIPLMEEKSRQYRKKGVNTTSADAIIGKARSSFYDERYDEAEDYMIESDRMLESSLKEFSRFRNIISLSKSFIVKYWYLVIILLVILYLSAPAIAKKARMNIAKIRLNRLRTEQLAIEKILKNVQTDYLQTRTISKQTYDITVADYKGRMTDISRMIVILEARARGEKYDASKEKKGILEVK